MFSSVVHLIHCSMSYGEFVSTKNLAHSPLKAKNKSWFGIMESYNMLDGAWTILSETSRFAQQELGNMSHDDEAGENKEVS